MYNNEKHILYTTENIHHESGLGIYIFTILFEEKNINKYNSYMLHIVNYVLVHNKRLTLFLTIKNKFWSWYYNKSRPKEIAQSMAWKSKYIFIIFNDLLIYWRINLW